MLPRLPQMDAPTLMFWLYAAGNGIASALAPDGARMPWRAEWLAEISLAFIMSSWVMADVRKRGRALCYDYDSLVFFLWWMVVPVYLFQTRGLKAFLTLLCFAGIWLIAVLSAILVTQLRGPIQSY